MIGKLTVVVCFFLVQFTAAQSMSSIEDTLVSKSLEDVVVTATRTERKLGNAAIPTFVISQQQMRLSGLLRLNEVLQEQTGIFVTGGTGSGAIGGGIFGNGIQLQGLSPDHTIILLDGEPLIGRQGGVMDLSRFAIGNIKKVEIVKGPSSSIYGSEAMGGVVNIITETAKGREMQAGIRSGSFFQTDAYLSGMFARQQSALYYFLNRNSSNGYDLDAITPERTQDPFHNYTAHVKYSYRFSPFLKFVLNSRYFQSKQERYYAINSPEVNVGGNGRTKDIHVNPVFSYARGTKLKSTLRVLASHYRFTQGLDSLNNQKQYYFDDFRQGFFRMENQTDLNFSKAGTLTLGAGHTIQAVNTTRYRGKKVQQISHAFVQYEWLPLQKLQLIGGMRYDHNSAFGARLSPKLAVNYQYDHRLRFMVSYGAGFKAPDFRQLYLSFVNNAADGYSIFGASEFSVVALQAQLQQGLIAQILPAAASIIVLRPEVSTGINLGVQAQPSQDLKISANLFRNNIRHLINFIPVATQANGSYVFSYININTALTQGVEVQLEKKFRDKLQVATGYQFLFTADREALQAVKSGAVFGRDIVGGPARRMLPSDYSGLFNRSRHMANLRLFYEHQKAGWSGTMRFIYRSRMGVIDLDGNNFSNMKEEFSTGMLQVNMSVGNSVTKHISMQVGINNLLNQIDTRYMPAIPGRHYFVSIQFIQKN
jgi:outer membrane receptor for ferrienterochelin and colicins